MVQNPPTFHKPQSIAADAYRRRARRVRHVYQNDLPAMHLALGAVAREHDKERVDEQIFHSLPAAGALSREIELHLPGRMIASAGSAGRFASMVAQALEGGVLRYSQRMSLLQEAARRGIGRFEANLIIAAVQHQLGLSTHEAARSPSRLRVPPLVIALLVEAVMITCLWLLI